MNILDGVNILGDIITGKAPNIKKNRDNDEEYHVYTSNTLNKGIKKIKDKAKIRYEKSRDPVKTGIINRLMRHHGSNRKSIIKENFDDVRDDSEFSDDPSLQTPESIDSISKNPNLLINQSGKLIDNRFHERQFVKKDGINDSFISQYDDMKFDMKGAPSSFNAVHRSDSGVNRLQTERNLALKENFSNFDNSNDNTYGIVDPKTMTHTNMTPQFKGKSYGSDILAQKNRADTHQRKMQEFTGNDIKLAKTENKPLFSPLVGITNIYGMPSVTNLIQDRYMPGKERKNELPFRQQRITTGLNLGYNEVNKNGDNFRALPKTIDELRTADRHQKSYTFSQVKGMAGIGKGPVVGDIKKYKPERTKYWGDYRLVPSLGYIRAPAIYGEVNQSNLATINRGTTDRTMINPAGSEIQQATPDNVREKYKVDFKQNFKQAEPRNIQLIEGLLAREDEKKYIPDPTQRSKELNYTGPLGTSQINKGTAFDMITNIFDTTKRNITERFDRVGQGAVGDMQKGVSVDFNDILDPTLRDIIDKFDRYGVSSISDYAKAQFFDPNDITKTTMRNIHDKYDRYGRQIQGYRENSYAIDYSNAIPDPTMRDVHSKPDRAGQFKGDRQNQYVLDSINAIPDPTMRDVHSKPDRAGQFKGDRQNQYVLDSINAIPDPTMRDVHSKPDRAGQFKGDRQNQYVIDSVNAIPDQTMRDIHSKPDRAGHMTGDRQNQYVLDNINAIPDQTMRDIHSKPDRAGHMTGDRQNQYVLDNINAIPDQTMRDIHSKTDRAGHMTGDKQSDYVINYTLFTPDPTMRDIHDKTDRAGQLSGDKQQNYAYDYINATPDITKREMYSKLDRANAGASGVYYATRTRDDAKNAYVNQVKEIISKGRAPTKSNYSKGPSMDYTTVSLCEPIQIKRDLLSSTIQINDKLPFILTKMPDGRTTRNNRMNEFTKDNLNENPFINNIVHKSTNI